MVKQRDTQIDTAGVFRCCLYEVSKLEPDEEIQNGRSVKCPCGDGMTFHDGTWYPTWVYRRDYEKR